MSSPACPEPSVTAILLSWRRHAMLERIAADIAGWDRIGEVIVWNNDPDTALSLPFATVVHSGRNFGCLARYAMIPLARHDTIWFQDDDLIISQPQFERIHAAYAADPSRIYGRQGRNLKDGRYVPKAAYGECDIMLGQTMLFHRSLLRHLTDCLGVVPLSTFADDIAFSLACPSRHFAVDVEPVEEIGWNDDNALWRRPGHFDERQDQVDIMLARRKAAAAG
jgi:hypothetical protein